MPTADFATTTEGAEISGNAGKGEICKTLDLRSWEVQDWYFAS